MQVKARDTKGKPEKARNSMSRGAHSARLRGGREARESKGKQEQVRESKGQPEKARESKSTQEKSRKVNASKGATQRKQGKAGESMGD